MSNRSIWPIDSVVYSYNTTIHIYAEYILTQRIKDERRLLKKKKIPLSLLQGLHVRGSWRQNRTVIYWPPLLWPSALCLSRSPDAQPEARGPTLLAFSTASYHQLVWSPNSIGSPEGPFCWVVAFSTSSDLQLADFLSSPSYIIVQLPTQSLEWHVW